ncbi:MAG: hypothetical protein E7172_04280 [Firmicutes bacterium]|nr:hypothetical protein [Bacillota bacterium]
MFRNNCFQFIYNDIDFLKFLRDKNNQKLNIFDGDIKNTYVIYLNTKLMYSSFDTITFINGDYEGFILDGNNRIIVNIYYNNKRYMLTFTNKENFSIAYILDLIVQ